MSPILTKSGQAPTYRELRSQASAELEKEVKEGFDKLRKSDSSSKTCNQRHPELAEGDVGWDDRPGSTDTESEDLVYGTGQPISRQSSQHSPKLPLTYARRDYTDAEDDVVESRTLPTDPSSKWIDLRNLLLASTPSLLLGLIGLVFTGELLEHLARWRVFRSVDELFILVPVIGNLKGNLEMCLSARLGTSANIGELDKKRTRHALLFANLSLLQLQALLISSVAAFLSFLLGLLTTHRIGDAPPPPPNALAGYSGIPVGNVDYQEGYTRPGWKQLMMVLATGMGAASISSAVLGSFMSSLIVGCRWIGVDPDNITAPLAACLGDLLTLFILALLGTLLVGAMDTAAPLIAVILLFVAAGWFTRRVMRDRWVKAVAKGGWGPLIAAMFISSCTGMVLERSVGRYKGYSLLAVSMTGLTGSIGAIHASRLSTLLHVALSNPSSSPKNCLTPKQAAFTLFLAAFPVQACFVAFVEAAGWVTVDLGIWCWGAYTLTAMASIVLAHWMTNFFWSRELDPDSYTLPLHSSLIDLIGQLLLVGAYEGARIAGREVMVDGWDL